MPSPIAHLGAGYAIYRLYKQKLPADQKSIWKIPLQLILVAGLSMLPDLDVIPALLFRDMRAYHNNFSHSLFFGIPVAFAIAGIFQRAYRSNFWLWFGICLLSYDLHVVMDALTAERGVMLFWPLPASPKMADENSACANCSRAGVGTKQSAHHAWLCSGVWVLRGANTHELGNNIAFTLPS
jgi:membrane-bound metal-dependent hydrolase YbcI (DUF457 family)